MKRRALLIKKLKAHKLKYKATLYLCFKKNATNQEDKMKNKNWKTKSLHFRLKN